MVSDTPHLREKTYKVGLIGRAAAVFCVDEVIIFSDGSKAGRRSDAVLMATLLSYMETPQYLRKHVFKLRPELKYAGILPPLRTAHHPLMRKTEGLRIGEYREGVTLSATREGTTVDIGVEEPAVIRDASARLGKRVTVKITGISRPVEVRLVDRGDVPGYWGYCVTDESRSFGGLLKNRNFDLTVATSRQGSPLADVLEKMRDKWRGAEKVLVAFGAPTRGLNEIAASEGLRLRDVVDFVVNTIPGQGTETVRTEEALFASLAVLNVELGRAA